MNKFKYLWCYENHSKADAKYKGETASLTSSTVSALNHRDGDEFGFTISSEQLGIDSKEQADIELSIKDLYLDI